MRLLQAAQAGAVSVREGQRPRGVAVFGVQIGGQAVGIPRPAAGKAGVKPGVVGLAGKRGGLAVPSGQAVWMLVREVARTGPRVTLVPFVFLFSVQPPSN